MLLVDDTCRSVPALQPPRLTRCAPCVRHLAPLAPAAGLQGVAPAACRLPQPSASPSCTPSLAAAGRVHRPAKHPAVQLGVRPAGRRAALGRARALTFLVPSQLITALLRGTALGGRGFQYRAHTACSRELDACALPTTCDLHNHTATPASRLAVVHATYRQPAQQHHRHRPAARSKQFLIPLPLLVVVKRGTKKDAEQLHGLTATAPQMSGRDIAPYRVKQRAASGRKSCSHGEFRPHATLGWTKKRGPPGGAGRRVLIHMGAASSARRPAPLLLGGLGPALQLRRRRVLLDPPVHKLGELNVACARQGSARTASSSTRSRAARTPQAPGFETFAHPAHAQRGTRVAGAQPSCASPDALPAWGKTRPPPSTPVLLASRILTASLSSSSSNSLPRLWLRAPPTARSASRSHQGPASAAPLGS